MDLSPPSAGDATSLRTHLCGTLRGAHVGQTVRLGGWIHRMRDLGGIVFIDVRDRAGLVQVSFDPASTQGVPPHLTAEAVVIVEGIVERRPNDQRNGEMPTGDIEVRARAIHVVGPANTPAIPVARGPRDKLAAEELRLRHRYLDLRRPEMQANIRLRHALLQATRRFLSDRGFLEIETPVLTKPTPEGARDYLVPSRVHAGEFYALPQSPQLYKQLLMVAGFDRYFQIARCFRDEDLRADRQPEFSQIDIEASFVDREDVIALTEGLLATLFAVADVPISTPFPRMSYAQAMEDYGIDRPDLRFGLKIADRTEVFRSTDFGIARSVIANGGRVRGVVVPGGATITRKEQDELQALAKSAGLGGLIVLKRVNGALEGVAAKFLGSSAGAQLELSDGDTALLAAGPDAITGPALDRIRQEVAARRNLIPPGDRRFVWVLDFPMFERDGATGRLTAVHHPFTAPLAEDIPSLHQHPERARARAYDVVLNGIELGGGSIRIHDSTLQEQVFALLGINDATAHARFGFLLEGLRAGAPPHGGIALGFDRIAMLLSGSGSLRDVIAFPKTTAARALFEGAPTPVNDEDLRDLHIHVDSDAGE
ncbi:MAG: aspartate--tRNA ligase [Gemmatimonadaceae bacterium]